MGKSSFAQAVKRLETANAEMDDFAGRYFILSGDTYPRIHFGFAYNGRHMESSALTKAEKILDRKGIPYKFPVINGNMFEETAKIQPPQIELTDDIESAIIFLKHYGFEISEKEQPKLAGKS